MTIQRREFLKASAASSLLPFSKISIEKKNELGEKLALAMNTPVLRVELFKSPVKIASIDLLKNGKNFIVRVRSTDGGEGISSPQDSVMATTYPIFLKRVAPFFIGKDARELESLIHEIYLRDSNYKWQGLPFWVCVSGLEIAILDLLGKFINKPLGELFGKIIRQEIPVYRASGNRGNTPEQEIAYLQKIVGETGAKAIKFRLGARMEFNDSSTKCDHTMIPLTRKTFGDQMAIYADGNGSYDVPMAIKTGRMMEEYKLAFFEEPVPFDYYDETKQIADTLKIPIALGEQEGSLRSFRRIIENDIAQVIQPDLLYFGGLTRSIRVARMAAIAGKDCTPHMSGGGLGFLYVAHFASCVPNCGAHQEYKGEEDTLPVSSDTSSLKSVKGLLKVPTGPGFGITIDPDYIKKSQVVTA